MEEKKLRDVMSKFSGNIQAAYNLARTLREEFDIDLDINFDSTNSLPRFTNIVRNMISRSVIQKPIKSGRTLILDERSFLQLVVARKYLSAGCSLDSLSGYLVEMPTNDIYERLFSTQLPDVDTLTRKQANSARTSSQSQSDTSEGNTSPKNLYFHIKVGAGLVLHVKPVTYTPEEISDMVDMLKEYLIERPRTKKSE